MTCWLGLDGEGIGRRPHRYVLLGYSDAQGNGDSIEDLQGLTTHSCLDFLLSAPKGSRLAGYFLQYDWTMILADLPNRSIYRLFRPELRALPRDEGDFSRVRWGAYRLHWIGGMMRIAKGERSITVWDLGKFFQAPFVDSLEHWAIDAPRDMIAAQKEKRSEFSRAQMPTIRAYHHAECRALASLASELEHAHAEIGLKPKAWFGPGSTASVALDTLQIKKRRGDIPPAVQYAADRAFFGGRFEHSGLGTWDHVAGYDIASAYPYQAYNLPCLEHGKWEWVINRKAMRSDPACVRYRLHDIGNEPWAPLPCRLGDGTIVFPRRGSRGWVWRAEYEMAAQHWQGVQFEGAWVLRRDCECQPFAHVLPWYRERIALGKSARGRVLKLALNSIYGKLAQTVGKRQYSSRVWAGMITSGTRAQLLDLLVRHKDRRHVLALATDGLYSTECVPLGGAPLAPDTLGSWEAEYHGRMTFLRPGIYWAHDDPTLRARGLGRKKLLAQRAIALEAIDCDDRRAHLGYSTTFGGAKACVYRLASGTYRRSEYYGQWHSIPARINLDPAPKRRADWSLHILNGVESAPYRPDVLSDDAKSLKAIGAVLWASK